jgi:hypothetical protein
VAGDGIPPRSFRRHDPLPRWVGAVRYPTSRRRRVVDRHRRPDGASDETVAAVGRASEALEYVERVRGLLYEAHQLMGRADFLFEDAADRLESAGHSGAAERIRKDVVGRNVLDGRWTFQIVEEFDDIFYGPVRDQIRRLEEELMAGRRHVYEAELKEQRRTRGRPGHESRPPAADSPSVETR